jgi:hypothetical protein
MRPSTGGQWQSHQETRLGEGSHDNAGKGSHGDGKEDDGEKTDILNTTLETVDETDDEEDTESEDEQHEDNEQQASDKEEQEDHTVADEDSIDANGLGVESNNKGDANLSDEDETRAAVESMRRAAAQAASIAQLAKEGTIGETVKSKERGVRAQIRLKERIPTIIIPACWDDDDRHLTMLNQDMKTNKKKIIRNNKIKHSKQDSTSNAPTEAVETDPEDAYNVLLTEQEVDNLSIQIKALTLDLQQDIDGFEALLSEPLNEDELEAIDEMEAEQLFHKEVKQLEKDFSGVMIAKTTDKLVNRKTARRLALSARSVLRRVRAEAAMMHHQHVAHLQQEKEVLQQEKEGLRQAAKQKIQDLRKQVKQQFEQQIRNSKGEIAELKAALSRNRKSTAIGFGYGMTKTEQQQGYLNR